MWTIESLRKFMAANPGTTAVIRARFGEFEITDPSRNWIRGNLKKGNRVERDVEISVFDVQDYVARAQVRDSAGNPVTPEGAFRAVEESGEAAREAGRRFARKGRGKSEPKGDYAGAETSEPEGDDKAED